MISQELIAFQPTLLFNKQVLSGDQLVLSLRNKTRTVSVYYELY